MTRIDSAHPRCPQCDTELAPELLMCPSCGALVFADELNGLAAAARQSHQAGDISSELTAWRKMLELLPADTRQYQLVQQRISALTAPMASGQASAWFPTIVGAEQPAPQPPSPFRRATAGLGALGVLLWKLKTILLGLTKLTTLLSMLASLGLYWTIWGWRFALGIVLSIYIHEMGHVISLRKLGFKATAPMFIPGIGAVVRLQQEVVNPMEDAEIGLAGPLYGLGAAVLAGGMFWVTRKPIFAAIAAVGAIINLFNLVPVWTLDGGRGFHGMTRTHKWIATAAMAGSWWWTRHPLPAVIAIIAGFRALSDPPAEGITRPRAVVTYVILVLSLTAVFKVLQPLSGVQW